MSVIQLKRGTAASWTTHDPILAAGELGVETDTHKIKLGDGTTQWSALDYLPTAAALEGLEPAVNAGSSGQYYRGDKTWQTLNKAAVGLDSVDNTSDATKNSATATLTNKTISGSSNTLSNIPQSAVTNLSTDLAAKESTANKGQAGGYASLDSGGKVPAGQLPNSIMEYQGTWNPSTNSPTLADGTGSAGDVYRVTTTGSRNLGSGSISFTVGDYVIYNGSTWEKSDTTDAVATVNGYVGNVTLSASDVGLGNVDNTSDATKNSATVTLTNKTLTNPTINAYTEGVAALGTVSSSATISISAATVVTATLTASTACTFTMPTAGAGKSFTLLLKQAASTGGGTATFTGVKWGSTGAPTVTAAAGKMDILTFFSDGTNWYGSAAQGFTP